MNSMEAYYAHLVVEYILGTLPTPGWPFGSPQRGAANLSQQHQTGLVQSPARLFN